MKEGYLEIAYEDCSDEELILRLRDGERAVEEFLLDKYKNLVRKKAGTMFILGADREDLIQEGMIGLFKAMRDFDCGRDASFMTFADLCVARQMYNAVETAKRKKHQPLNSYVSLDAPEETMQEAAGRSPEDLIIDRENFRCLAREIEQALSPFEQQVLELHLTGMPYDEVARVLGRDKKSTDNALQRIKTKLRKFL